MKMIRRTALIAVMVLSLSALLVGSASATVRPLPPLTRVPLCFNLNGNTVCGVVYRLVLPGNP